MYHSVTVSIPSSELGLSRMQASVTVWPPEPKAGVHNHICLRLRGQGNSNSDDKRLGTLSTLCDSSFSIFSIFLSAFYLSSLISVLYTHLAISKCYYGFMGNYSTKSYCKKLRFLSFFLPGFLTSSTDGEFSKLSLNGNTGRVSAKK